MTLDESPSGTPVETGRCQSASKAIIANQIQVTLVNLGRLLAVPNDLKGKAVAIIAADEFEDLELFHPLYRLQEEGIKTVVVGLTKDPIKGKKGYSITPNASIDEANAENFDFLVIPGGKSPEKLRLNNKILKFVKDFHTQGKPIAAICHAGQVLASAGIVKNRTLTSVAGIKDDMTNDQGSRAKGQQ